jgi:DNA-binding transcriptional MerR regulator
MTKRPATAPAPEPALPEGRYRIATVASVTGVPEPTLRAWERRYGIPQPERTASGYRLYGDEDLRTVTEMRRLCNEGLAAAEAAAVLRQRRALGQSPAGKSPDPTKDAYALAAASILDAVEAFDDVALESALRRLLFVGNAVSMVDQVIAPLLRVIGDKWHSGELSVAQEHLASQSMGTMLRDLVRMTSGPQARAPALLACYADEEHELGLLAFGLRLPELGIRPVLLGARTPPEALATAVEACDAKLVALSVTMPPDAKRARELTAAYAEACSGRPWVVGGSGVAAVAKWVEKRGGVTATAEQGAETPSIRSVLRAVVSPARAPPALRR